LRLRYASIAFLLLAAACGGPGPMSRDEAISVARSHVHGDALIQGAELGRHGDLAPPDVTVDDPNRLVWVVTLRGVFSIDCKVELDLTVTCPRQPTFGILVLDGFDGSALTITRITPVPPTAPPPSDGPGVVT